MAEPQTDIASQGWSYDGVNAPAPSVAGVPNSIDSMTPPAPRDKTLPSKTGGDPISGGSDIYSGGADLYRQHIAQEDAQNSKTDRLVAQDRQRLEKAQAQEAHAPQDIHDWNEEAQKEKYAAKPLQSFGSLGVIFATLASAFTHQPMINALNGSAAAMNAIKDGKDEEYKRAFTAWKENTELAVKRQQMQHQTYEDVFKLLDTDITLGAIKSKEAAQRFGDQQMLFFIDNGMWDEADKLKANRLKYAEGIQDLSEKSDDYHMRGWAYQQNYEKLTPEQKQDPNVVMNLWNNTHGIGKTNADQQQLVNWMLSHPMPPGDDQAKLGQWFKDYTAFGQSLKKLPGTAGVTTADRDIERAVQSEEAKWRQEGKSEEEIADLSAQRRSQLRTESAGVTGNQREKDESHIEMYDNSMAKIDGVTGVLDKYVGAAGIAGKATRTAERVRDLFGSNDTDRVQMSRDIEYLQAVAPQLLFDRAGRPLASESSRINDIIAGLNMGDTTANTLRSLKELKTLYQKMQADAKKRQPASGGSSPATATPPAAPKAAPWANDPVVQ